MSVARESRLIVGAQVMEDRSWDRMQAYADELPFANRYCTDELAVYAEILWPPNPQGGPSSYVISYGKDETYTIEGMNADLRTYLGSRQAQTPLTMLLPLHTCPSSSTAPVRVVLQQAPALLQLQPSPQR